MAGEAHMTGRRVHSALPRCALRCGRRCGPQGPAEHRSAEAVGPPRSRLRRGATGAASGRPPSTAVSTRTSTSEAQPRRPHAHTVPSVFLVALLPVPLTCRLLSVCFVPRALPRLCVGRPAACSLRRTLERAGHALPPTGPEIHARIPVWVMNEFLSQFVETELWEVTSFRKQISMTHSRFAYSTWSNFANTENRQLAGITHFQISIHEAIRNSRQWQEVF